MQYKLYVCSTDHLSNTAIIPYMDLLPLIVLLYDQDAQVCNRNLDTVSSSCLWYLLYVQVSLRKHMEGFKVH
jgi:hypothetical protein